MQWLKTASIDEIIKSLPPDYYKACKNKEANLSLAVRHLGFFSIFIASFYRLPAPFSHPTGKFGTVEQFVTV
jgi:hypothetical protein